MSLSHKSNDQANDSTAATKPVQSWRDHPADDPLPPTGLDLPGENTRILAQHADAIRFFRKRAGADVAEIGRRLMHCRTILKEDGCWRAWLESEFGWSPQTAGRFIQVHEMSQEHSNLEHLELPVSALYLLAAPSTPPEARDEIIERASQGEKLTHAQVKETIWGRKLAKNPPGLAALHAAKKLGPDIMARIKGTSLDTAAERKALIRYNRGAPEGGHTEDVELLVAAAERRAPVSAVALLKTGKKSRSLPSLDDIGSDSRGENARLQAQVDELQAAKRQLEIKIKGYESEIEDLKAALAKAQQPADIVAAWNNGTDAELSAGMTCIGLEAVLKVMPHWRAELKVDPPRQRGKQLQEMRLADAVDDAFSSLSQLADECRGQVESAPQGISESARIQTLDATASVLEDLEEPDVAAELAAITIALPKHPRPRSRADRRSIALGHLAACVEQLDTVGEGDPRHDEACALRDALENALSEAESCEF